MLLPLDPITAVVTGANRGIGLALAHGLADAGARVILTSRDGRGAVAAASHSRMEAYSAPLDVSSARDVRAFGEFLAQHATPNVLINNAGVNSASGWAAADVRRTVAVNVFGPLAMTRAVVPAMAWSNIARPCVINISSGDGELAYLHTALQDAMRAASTERQVLELIARAAPPRNEFGLAPAHGPAPAYAVSKAALNALTRATAARLGAKPDRPDSRVRRGPRGSRAQDAGVWVGAVCPGDVRTRMCTAEDPADALEPEAAAADVLWLLERAALSGDAMPSGRFWRSREQIDF